MKIYEDYVEKVNRLLRDKAVQTEPADVESALENANDTLRLYRTATKVEERTADGGRLYSLPTDWDEELGNVEIEYPVDPNADQVSYLDPELIEIYNTPDGVKLRFRSRDGNFEVLPASGAKFRIHYKVPYVLTKSKVTVPDSLFNATCKLGARELCLIRSTRYAQQASNLLDGDTADYRDKSDKFLNLAKEFWKDFQNTFTAGDGQTASFSFGTFRQTPTHRDQRSIYPRDSANRSYAEL